MWLPVLDVSGTLGSVQPLFHRSVELTRSCTSADQEATSEMVIPHGSRVALGTSRGNEPEIAGTSANEGEIASLPGAQLALSAGGMRAHLRVLGAAADAPPTLRMRIVP